MTKTLLLLLFLIIASCPVFSGINNGDDHDTIKAMPWVQSEGSYHSSGNALATDREGNIYVTGSFEEWMYFNDVKVEAHGKDWRRSDIFIAKYDPQGRLVWYDVVGGHSDDAGLGIAVSHNNVYITGFFSGKATFRGESIQTTDRQNMFLANYSRTGELKWVTQATGDGVLRGKAITADSKGNVYVTGNFREKVQFGRYTVHKKMQQNIYLVKYDSLGKCQWLKQGGGGVNLITYLYVYDIACDGEDNIFLAGEMMGPVRFEHLSHSTSYAYYQDGAISRKEIFIVKYDPYGNLSWIRDACAECQFGALEVDDSGNILLSGYFKGAVNGDLASRARFGKEVIVTTHDEEGQPTEDIFLARYDQNARLLWVKKGGGQGDDRALHISTDKYGSIYLTGYFSQDFRMDDQMITEQTRNKDKKSDILVAKLSRNGVLQWMKPAGSSKMDLGQAIISDNNGNIYLTGSIEGNAYFGNTHVTSKGYNNFFLAKYFAEN